jgi:hypothetical protein
VFARVSAAGQQVVAARKAEAAAPKVVQRAAAFEGAAS